VWDYLRELLKDYGDLKAVCMGGSRLYTPTGVSKICVPRFEPRGEGKKLPPEIAGELLEEEVLFALTDEGIVIKRGRDYLFFPEGAYRLIWKTKPF